MRLKTKLVLAITGLVFLVVCALSWIFLGQLLRQRISQAYSANDVVAHQILSCHPQAHRDHTVPMSTPTTRRHCGRRWPRPCAAIPRSPRF